MIGAKTLGILAALAVALAVSASTGLLRPERLLALHGDAAFVIGALAVVAAALVYRFGRLSERSARYFRFSTDRTPWEDEAHFLGTERRRVVLGDNVSGEAFDLPPPVQLATCLLLGLLLGLATIGARALSLLQEFPLAVTAAGSTWCPEEDADTAVDARVDPHAPGCALIRRAYELGYAKSLGECARARRGPQVQVCTLRQRDEPYLHYAYRLLGRFGGGVSDRASAGAVAGLRLDFDQRMERVELLYGSQRQVMASAPHASHHLWTNLPDPGGAFDERTCIERYRELPHRTAGGEKADRSKVLEHVLAQLLFESRYEPAAGYCREYRVHWGAPADACRKLAADPEGFLAGSGSLEPVRAVLARYRLGQELGRYPAASAERRAEPPPFLSFQCYVESPEGGAEQRAEHRFELGGQRLVAQELVVPPATGRGLHVDRYRQVGNLLAPTFHYGALLSEAGLTSRGSSEGLTEAFSADDFLLSRVHTLASVDVFLDPEWIARREDLLDLYPYHLHLKNFVQLFRQQYRLERGRL